jgi:hypothetical protein
MKRFALCLAILVVLPLSARACDFGMSFGSQFSSFSGGCGCNSFQSFSVPRFQVSFVPQIEFAGFDTFGFSNQVFANRSSNFNFGFGGFNRGFGFSNNRFDFNGGGGRRRFRSSSVTRERVRERGR